MERQRVPSVPESVRLASRWLTGSGIQNESRDRRLRGGVAAWYEIDRKVYPFLYSEITGYALSAWIFLNKVLKTRRYLKHSGQAAQWLMRHAAAPGGGVKTRFYLVKHYVSPNYCFHHGRVYAFDTSMVGYGVLQLYRETKQIEHLESAHRLLRFLIDKMRRKDGLFYAYYDSKTGSVGQDLEKWSDQAGSFHAKLALFFVDYYLLTQKDEARSVATRLLDTVVKNQKPDGRFVTGLADDSTHLHPHAYTLEGLLYGGVYLKKEAYLKSARKGFEWMLKGVSEDGSVSSNFVKGLFSHHERSDIVAQALRVGSVLCALYPELKPKLSPTLERIRQHLLLFQNKEGVRQRGGFLYGAATDGLMRPHLNAWATMFALQALWMHEQFVAKRKPLDLASFV